MITRPSNRRQSRRPAATLVESAFVLSIFFLFLFGIIEFSRYIMFLHVATNAIRDAGRYASVNVDKPSNFPTTDFTQGAYTYTSIEKYALLRLGQTEKMLDPGYTIEVFPCDPTQLALTPPVVAPKPGYTSWNEASFTERICVRLTGQYRFYVFSALFTNPTINVRITSVVGSEG